MDITIEKLTQLPPPTPPSQSTQPPPPPHLLTIEHVTSPKNQNNTNDHDNPKNPASQEDGSTSTNESQNGSSSFRSNDDVVVEELFENSTNQQTIAENPKMGPSHDYEEARPGINDTTQQNRVGNSGTDEPSHFYNILPYVNTASYRPARVGNFGPIGPSRGHVRMLHNENNTNQQTGNSGILPYRPLGNNTNELPLVRNLRIELGPVSNSSLMRRRCENMTRSLEVYRGRLVSMSKDEDGSKYLQRILGYKNPKHITTIIEEVVDDLHDLMKDIFGKNVIEKIFDVLDGYPLTLFLELITTNPHEFLGVCQNNIGYKVVMSMIDHLNREDQRNVLTFTLNEIAVSLATSRHGSDVLQHFLRICPNDFLEDILPKIAFECDHIARTRIGSSLLQKCLSVATPDKISCRYLFDQVINIVFILARDQYGNYVVQRLIRMGLLEKNDSIANRLRGHYVEFSTHQNASNVVECLLRFSYQKNVEIIVQEILNSSAFLSVIQDAYGNFVAQTALESSQGDMHVTLANTILQYEQVLCNDQYGRRVLEFMYGGGTLLPRFRRHLNQFK